MDQKKENLLTSSVRLQSIQKMTSMGTYYQCQNQLLQHGQKPCLALSEAQFCEFPGLLEAEL